MLFLVTIVLCGAIAFSANIPDDKDLKFLDDFPSCFQDDPKLNDCIKNAVQGLLPKLHKGNKGLGIPPLDPFVLANNRYDYNSGGIQGSVALKDVKIYGGSRVEIKTVDTKILDNGITSAIEVLFPRVFVEGGYKGDVKINEIKMTPKGVFNITLTNIKVLNKIGGIFETIKGARHLRVNSFDMGLDIGDMKIYASGLLPDPQLNSIVLEFINQYWPEVYKLILPETKVYWEPLLIEAANQFFLNVPLDMMLKPRV